jgi:hypothetical protein
MNSIRAIAKINLLISAVITLSWVAYRFWSGLPMNEKHFGHDPGPAWLMDLATEAFFIYLFFFDKKISELFVRGCGLMGAFGLIFEIVITLLTSQTGDSLRNPIDPSFSWYAWPSIIACALIGRKSLSQSEMKKLDSIWS